MRGARGALLIIGLISQRSGWPDQPISAHANAIGASIFPFRARLALSDRPSWSPRAFFLPRSWVRSSASGRGEPRQQALRKIDERAGAADRIARWRQLARERLRLLLRRGDDGGLARRGRGAVGALAVAGVEVTWRVSAFAAPIRLSWRFWGRSHHRGMSAPGPGALFRFHRSRDVAPRAAARSAPAGPAGDVPRARHHGVLRSFGFGWALWIERVLAVLIVAIAV